MLKKYVLPVGIIVFICLSLGIGLTVMVLRLGEAQESSVKEQQRTLLSNLSVPVQSALQSTRLAAEFVAVSTMAKAAVAPSVHYDRAETDYEIQRIMGLFPLVEGVFILNEALDPVLSSAPLDHPPDFAASQSVRQALMGRRTISSPMRSPVTDNLVLAVSAPVSRNDAIKGVAVVLVNLRKVADMTINRMQVGNTGYAVLLDAAGCFMLHPDMGLIGTFVGDSELGQQILGGMEGFASGVWRGQQKWVAYSTLPERGWKLLVTLDYAEFVSQTALLRDKALFMGGMLVLFVILVVGWLTVRLMSGLDNARLAAERSARAKSDFLANMSHEIRTPMNGIMGLTQLLQQTQLTPKQAEYLHKIRFSGKSLLRLLNDILDMSKIEANKLDIEHTDCSVADVVQFIRAAFETSIADKGLRFVVDVSPSVPPVLHTDPHRLGQILLNLVGNAVKFTEQGEVRLSMTVKGLNPDQPYLPFMLAVEVRDSGIGIRPEELSRLFTPFSQADSSTTRRFGGTGLGLVICAQLVGLMGGDIQVESEVGKGSVFRFSICCHQATTQEPSSSLSAPGGQATGNRVRMIRPPCVLLAEDNEINQLVAVELLRGMGADVHVAGNGAEAVRAARERTFDCIFMDIQMPVLDGLAAARQIRTFAPCVPMIAMTAHALPEDREKSFAAGMNAHLTKPLDVDALHDMLVRCTNCFADAGEEV